MRRAALVLLALGAAACSSGARSCSLHIGDTYVVVSGEEASGDARAAYALARILRDGAQLDVAAAATSGAVENLERLRDGGADLALATADVLADAVNGQGAFRGETVPARTIATLADATLHLVVRRDSSILGLSGLRGRRVSTGPSRSATELTAMRVLREALLDPQRDVFRQPLTLAEAVAALRDGKVDAFFWLDVVPVAAIHDAVSNGSLQVKLLSTASVVPLLQKRFGESLYSVQEWTGGTYGDPDPWAGVGVAVLIAARPDLPDGVASAAARGLLDRPADLAAAHPVFRGVTRERAARPAPAPLHPAAARYYRDAAR